MKINFPSWETSLPLAGTLLGSAAGLALRSDVCDVRTKFGHEALNLINSIGQYEIITLATTGAVLIPLAGKIAHDAYYSEKSGIVGKVVDAAKKNIARGQVIGTGLISGVGVLGMAGQLKPAMKAICNTVAPEIANPSGHFLTRVLTLPLALSVTKSISNNSSPTEKWALMGWCGLNAIKDGVMLSATIANCYHTPAEAIAGSLIGLAGVAGLNYVLSEPEVKEEPLPPEQHSANQEERAEEPVFPNPIPHLVPVFDNEGNVRDYVVNAFLVQQGDPKANSPGYIEIPHSGMIR